MSWATARSCLEGVMLRGRPLYERTNLMSAPFPALMSVSEMVILNKDYSAKVLP